MRYPLWLTTALLVVCAGAGQANETLNQAQAQAAQMQAAQLQAAQMQYQNQAYMAAAQQQTQQVQMPAMAGFAGAGAMPQGAGDAASMAQYFMPSTYAGYAGYNPYAYMYSGYGTMGYYPYYGGMPQQQQQGAAGSGSASSDATKSEDIDRIVDDIVERIAEKVPKAPEVVTPPTPQPPQVRVEVRDVVRTVPERSVPYIGINGQATMWAPFDYRFTDIPLWSPSSIYYGKGKPNGYGYGGQGVLGFECCRLGPNSRTKLRFEGEVGYNRYGSRDVDAINIGPDLTLGTADDRLEDLDGEIAVWSGAANFYLDYGVGALHPYVGVGVGGAMGVLDIKSKADPNIDLRDTAYMAQAMVGASVDIGANLAVNMGYRFRNFGEFGDYERADNYYWDLELDQVHAFEAGLRIKF